MTLLGESTDIGLHEIVSIKYCHGSTCNSCSELHRANASEKNKPDEDTLSLQEQKLGCEILLTISDVFPACVLAVMNLEQENVLSLCRFFVKVYVTTDMLRESAT